MNVDNMASLHSLNTKLKNKDFAMWFYANWCGHCKAMENEWSKVEQSCKRKNIGVVKVRDDFKDHVDGGLGKNVMGFPKIVMIRRGKEVAEHQGMRNSEDIMNTILKHLKPLNNKRSLKKSKNYKCSKKGCKKSCKKGCKKKSCKKGCKKNCKGCKAKHSKKNKLNNMKLNKLFKSMKHKSKKNYINIRNLLR